MRYKNYNKAKYNARKTTVDGITFDSAREARRYSELLLLVKAGEISDLRRQVKFELIPAQREPDTTGPRGGTIKGKLIERGISYIADFTYRDKAGRFQVEDVKGYKDGGAYSIYTVKRKLMLWRYGIRIREV